MVEYEINSNTLALIPIDNKSVRVYEIDNTFIVKENIMKIINESCKYFGSSYHGRLAGTKKLINVSVKAPIILEESKEIIFFPTTSPRIEKCSWISYNHINRYLKINRTTLLFFDAGKPIEIPVSYNIIDNQMTRAIKLHMAFIERKKKIKKNVKN